MTHSGEKSVAINLSFFLMAVSIIGITNTYAADKSEQSLKQTKLQISQTTSKHQALDKKLEKMDRSIAELTLKIQQAQSQLKQTKTERNQLNRNKDSFRKQSRQERQGLKKDIEQAYIMSRQHPLKLVMNQNQAGSIGRTLAYYDYYNRYRTRQLNELSAKITQIETIDSQLEVKQKELKVLLKNLNMLQMRLKSTRTDQYKAIIELETYLKQQNLKLDHIKNGQTVIRKTLSESRQTTQKLKADGTAFAKLRGLLPLPVSGKILRRFGSSRGGKQLKWQGLIISASSGSPVKAVAEGQVVFSDWLRGYGFLTIIDHGNEYMSLYGHNQNLLASVGTMVKANQVIATVGNSGGYRNPALYFELRKKGKPFNPARWLARR